MKKILYIDAAVRRDSRTRELADELVSRLSGEVRRLRLEDSDLPPLDEKRLEWRMECCRTGDFTDEYFRYAHEFASADTIVIAAPFWDNSFPAVLKKYIETVSVCGLTFRYSESGVPVGLCRAEKLWYVTTAGGPIYDDSFGYGYIASLAKVMFGVKETGLIKAENLDLIGADTGGIMSAAKRQIIESVK